jgi:hypothetical protein
MNRIRSKPLPGARVNPSHPLGVGLSHCYLFNETTGSPRNLGYVAETSPVVAWGSSPIGIGMVSGGGTGTNVTARPPVSSAFTFAFSWSPQAVNNSNQSYAGLRQTGGYNGAGARLTLRQTTTAGGLFVIQDSSAGRTAPAFVPITTLTGRLCTVAFSVDSTHANCYCYADGRYMGNATGAGNFQSCLILSWMEALAAVTGTLNSYCIWNRQLTSAEIVNWHTNPYAMILPSYALRTYSFGKKIQTKIALLEAA